MHHQSTPTRLCPRCKIRQSPSDFDRAPNGHVYSYCQSCRAKITPPKNPAPLEDPNPSGLCRCGCGGQVELIGRDGHGRGRKGHHRFYIKGHARPDFPEYTVNAITGCWIWRGGNVKTQYATVNIGGKKVGAYQMMWERHHGPIPEGTEIDHLCENPRCVNPDHLEPVTHAENVRRAFERATGK